MTGVFKPTGSSSGLRALARPRLGLKTLLTLLVVTGSSVPAMANTTNLGTLTENVPSIGAGVIGTAANPTDTYLFALSNTQDLSGDVKNPILNLGFGVLAGLTTASASIFSGTVGSGSFVGTITAGTTSFFTNLAAGSYYAVVSGTPINPLIGGAYSIGLLATPAAPAPGPAAILPVMAGAGALFWRRRKRSGVSTGGTLRTA